MVSVLGRRVPQHHSLFDCEFGAEYNPGRTRPCIAGPRGVEVAGSDPAEAGD